MLLAPPQLLLLLQLLVLPCNIMATTFAIAVAIAMAKCLCFLCTLQAQVRTGSC